ncbi:Glucocorticoid-induced transcript 1/FAM117 [Trinorchestia longiramus]|nr:Glucocorticoid-induced transcript 1/FAM117 [Trinorchestia longiramus]
MPVSPTKCVLVTVLSDLALGQRPRFIICPSSGWSQQWSVPAVVGPSSGRSQQWLVPAVVGPSSGGMPLSSELRSRAAVMVSIRRTASLDALTCPRPSLAHELPRPVALHALLLLHKHTQTPSAWVEDWQADPPAGWCGVGGVIPPVTPENRGGGAAVSHRNHTRRRPHSNPCSPRHVVPSGGEQPPPSPGFSSAQRTLLMRRTPERGSQHSPSSPPPLWCPSPTPTALLPSTPTALPPSTPTALPPSTPTALPPSTPTALPVQGEHLDKFIRQRLQQQQQGSGGMSPSSARQSPVPADHSIAVLSSVLITTSQPRPHDRLHPVARSGPLLPRPLLPRFRGSVEGLNQEIEGLVLSGGSWELQSSSADYWVTDGRRAPLPDYGLKTRSVNTQTTSSPHSASPLSQHSPHAGYSPLDCSFSPLACSPPSSPLGSPTAAGEDDGGRLRPNSSPHINKFLAREPPTGSQRVALKIREGRCDSTEPFAVPKPSVPFTLRPSLGSAFCPPQMRTSGSSDDGCKLSPNQEEGSLERLAPVVHSPDRSEDDGGAAATLTLDKRPCPSNTGLASLSESCMVASPSAAAAGLQ